MLVRACALGPPRRAILHCPFQVERAESVQHSRHSVPSQGTGCALTEQEQELLWPWGSRAALSPPRLALGAGTLQGSSLAQFSASSTEVACFLLAYSCLCSWGREFSGCNKKC